MASISPFHVDISKAEVERLYRKLRDTRVPTSPIVPDAGNDYGPTMDWVHRLYNKWLNDFNWDQVQSHLNRHKHFIASIPDESTTVRIHFTHTLSPRPDAIPLLLVHGWPGSFFEFDRVVDPFANPLSPSDPAFHVVVPSLPGFCWSDPPPRRAWTLQDNARVFDKLMTALEYSSYVVQAGDWGHFVARELGAKFSERCKAVHLNFAPSPRPEGLSDEELTPRERRVEKRCQDWLDDHLGYAVCMRTRPQTIGVALYDNPMGILMWVGEKYDEVASPAHKDEESWYQAILTQCSLYYFSNCIMVSMLPYYENVKHAEFGSFGLRPENRISVPMGYSSFFYDTRPGTKRGVERTGNMVFYNEIENGGHFAALECPDIILADCRKFFGQYYKP